VLLSVVESKGNLLDNHGHRGDYVQMDTMLGRFGLYTDKFLLESAQILYQELSKSLTDYTFAPSYHHLYYIMPVPSGGQ